MCIQLGKFWQGQPGRLRRASYVGFCERQVFFNSRSGASGCVFISWSAHVPFFTAHWAGLSPLSLVLGARAHASPGWGGEVLRAAWLSSGCMCCSRSVHLLEAPALHHSREVPCLRLFAYPLHGLAFPSNRLIHREAALCLSHKQWNAVRVSREFGCAAAFPVRALR